MTAETLNRYNPRRPEVKIFVDLDRFLKKYIRKNYILLKVLYQNSVVLGDLSIKKSEHPPVSGGIFEYGPAGSRI